MKFTQHILFLIKIRVHMLFPTSKVYKTWS